MKLRITKIGDVTAVILPEELLARLGLKAGDDVTATVDADGAFKLRAGGDQHERVMEIGRELFAEYRETFKALAK